MNEWYKQKLEAVGEIEPYLNQWGVSKNDLVISLPDYSMNGTLFLMNRKGFTDYANDFSKKETFDHYISIGTKYMVLNDTTLIRKEPFNQYTTRLIGTYKNVAVFDLRAKPNN